MRRMQNGPGLSGKFILRAQIIGFSTLLVIMWLVELFRLPHHFFGESAEFLWPRVLFRTATVLVIWLLVHLTTRRLLQRLHELERFLRICGWCRRVGHAGEWLTLEDYFNSRFATPTSHGICPACAEKQLAKHREAMRCEAVERASGKP